MNRITDQAVRDIVLTDPNIPVRPMINAATGLVDAAVALAASRGILPALTPTQQYSVEQYLAGHFYLHRDPQYQSRTTLSASGSFVTSDFLETAMSLDTTGCLRILIMRKKVQALWLGKPPSQQIPYCQRD